MLPQITNGLEDAEISDRSAPRVTAADVAALLRNRFLSSLPPEQLSEVLSAARWADFDPNGVMAQQSQPVDLVYFILRGSAQAEVVPAAKDTLKVKFDLLGPGDEVGLLSIVNGTLHSATVTAVEPLTAIGVPRAKLASLLWSYPEWSKVLAEIAVQRLRASAMWIHALT